MEQSFLLRLKGAAHENPDGSSRQAILSRCRPSDPVSLRREPNNPYDQYAIAVHRMGGGMMGYLPAGDRRLADAIDRGHKVSAQIHDIDGGPGLLDRILGRQGRRYGCVLRITKADPDWSAAEPHLKTNREIDNQIKEAARIEKTEPQRALDLYRQAAERIAAFDALRAEAQAWRTVRYPINRASLLLERLGRLDEALELIENHEGKADLVGLTASDEKAVTARRKRLAKKLGKT